MYNLFIYIPFLYIGYYVYINKNQFDYRIMILNQIHNMIYGYNYIKDMFHNCIAYFDIDKPDLSIANIKVNFVSNKNSNIHIDQEITYYYHKKIYKIIYDSNYISSKNYNLGDIIDINVFGKKNNIAMIEIFNKENNQTIIVSELFENYIKEYAGPNYDFYNYDKQPIYLYSNTIHTYIDNDDIVKLILDNTDNYMIHITYMDMTLIEKQINII